MVNLVSESRRDSKIKTSSIKRRSFLYKTNMETKTLTKNSMGWLQTICYQCKTCGKEFMIKEEAESCYDSHKK
jgi:predicted SprT family Zn-dependent metalloprotease